MAEITIEVPDTIEINWREFIKKAIELKNFELELERSSKLKLLLLKSITEKNKLSKEESEEFVKELSNKIKIERLNKKQEREK